MTGKFPLDHLRGGYPRPGGFLSSFPIKSLIKSSGSPTNRFIESGIKIPLVGEGFYDTGFYEKRIACIRNLFLFSTLRTGNPWASPLVSPLGATSGCPSCFLMGIQCTQGERQVSCVQPWGSSPSWSWPTQKITCEVGQGTTMIGEIRLFEPKVVTQETPGATAEFPSSRPILLPS